MLMTIKAAVVSAAFLAGPAGIAYAQGSITQDPGSLTPGNLTFQNLGPAGPVPGPTESRQTTGWPGDYGSRGTAGTAIGRGTSSTGFGAGNTAGFRGNATGGGR